MRTFGLIGKHLSHSFSEEYFTEKFLQEKITNTRYMNFELEAISKFKELIKNNNLSGLNVTIPYKEVIIPLLDGLDEEAKEIGAVNTIRFKNKKLIGYNTDHIGFTSSIKPLLRDKNNAIILGDGGAAKAVKYALKKLNIKYKTIKRFELTNCLDKKTEKTGFQTIIVNTTPVGSYPKTDQFPNIPYEYLNKNFLLFDLIYNPNETKFLAHGKARSAQIKNGLEMLQKQAEESWNIWNL